MTTSLPTGLNLATINLPPTPDEWNDAELAVANVLGLPTTTWQAGGLERTVFAVVANVQAQADIAASIGIQAGFLDFAATGTVTYTDATGATQIVFVTPDPSVPAQNPTGALGWLDVLADSVYNVRRILTAPASGIEALLNLSTSTYGPFAVGSYHIGQPGLPSKPTYSNKASLTIPPSSAVGPVTGTSSNSGLVQVTVVAHGLSTGAVVFLVNVGGTVEANGAWAVTVIDANNFTLQGSTWVHAWTSGGIVYSPTAAGFEADVPGTGSSVAGNNLVTTPITSLIGITVANVGQWLGTDTQNNTGLADLCRLKLQSISNGGPSGAYIFFALTAQTWAPLLDPPLTGRPSSPITRAISFADKTTGTVTTTIANSTGAPSGLPYPQPGAPIPDDGGDVYAVGAVIQAYAVPLATTSIVQAATPLAVTVDITAYVAIASQTAAVPVIQVATQAYFALLAIGGVTDDGGTTYFFPLQGLLDAVAVALSANSIRVQDMTGTLNGVASNLAMTATQVATLITPFNPTIVPV